MIQVTRDQIRGGQTFYLNKGRCPLIAIAISDGTMRHLKKAYGGNDPMRLWHVFGPTGELSWVTPSTLVWVDVAPADYTPPRVPNTTECYDAN